MFEWKSVFSKNFSKNQFQKMNCGEVKYSGLWSHYHEVAISIEHNCRQRSLKFFVANGFLSAFNRYTIYIPRLSFVKLNWLHMYGNTLSKKFDRQHKTNRRLLHSLVLHVTFTSWVQCGWPTQWFSPDLDRTLNVIQKDFIKIITGFYGRLRFLT